MRGILELLITIQNLLNAWQHAQAVQRKLDDAARKEREELETREARIAQAHNKNALLELQIEKRALENQRLRQKLGLTSETFTPADYD